MKRNAIFIFFSFVIFSCSENHCGFIENHQDTFKKLMALIKQNPDEFSNYQEIPRAYYTYNYQKGLLEFKKTESAKNISDKEYRILRDIFDELSIEKIMIYDNQNVLFKIKNHGFFVSDYNVYIAHLEEKDFDKIKKDFEVMDYGYCILNWHYFLERTSIAQ